MLTLSLIGSLAWQIHWAETVEPGIVRRVNCAPLPDTSGQARSLTDEDASKAVVLFFLGVECPVSNTYAPEMRRLAEVYGPRGVAFRGVHADSEVSIEAAARHKAEYGLNFPVLLDPEHELTDQCGATVTPEAFLLDRQGRVVYHGRLDDSYTETGRRRVSAHSHELQDALDATLAGQAPTVNETEAFGCPIPTTRALGMGEEVTYTKHVAPILRSRCVGCHRPGEVGQFSLLTYEDAAKRADFLSEVTASRRMPPWKARHGFGEFRDEARLSAHELATLEAWAEADTPEGDPADLPPLPPAPTGGWQLGVPDVVLSLPEPYPVAVGKDVYRAFALPLPLDQARGISAIEFRPDNRRVIHHARVLVDSTSASRRRDLADPAPGFATVGGNDLPLVNLGVWNPGVDSHRLPPGVGYTLLPGSDVVLLIHYHSNGKPDVDQSSVGLYYSNTPITRSMARIPLSTSKIDIPPGDANHKITLDATLPADVHAYSVLPHGHYLMREIKLWAILPDHSIRRLLWIDDWDINWQGEYHFAEPVALPRGTILHVVATYDNSSANPANPNRPPKRVRFGPASTDEMLGCHIQILTDRPEDDRLIHKKWGFSL